MSGLGLVTRCLQSCTPSSRTLKLRHSFAAKVKNEAVTTWVKPKLVAEVKFTEWTSKGEMRHPVYLGLRADKRAEEVSRASVRDRAADSRNLEVL